jgi:Rrf2 family transcriptional regulator, cysteine metabolism repressor
MRLSSTDIYTLKALAHLGTLPDGTWTHADGIAQAAKIPKPYLVRLLAALSSRGIVASRKGAGGGYSLSRPAHEITLLEVMRSIDGPIAALSCTSLIWPKTCPESERCQARGRVWTRVRDAIIAVLESTSVADLVEDAKAGVDYALCLDHLLRPHPLSYNREPTTPQNERTESPG